MIYTVILKHVASGDIYELPYKTVSYVEELNNGSQATFEFDYSTIKEQVCDPYTTNPKDLFTAVLSEITVKDSNNNVLWLGVISEYNRSKDASGNYSLQVAAIDYFSLLQKRRTGSDDIFSGVDPATIPWSLINTSQLKTSGNLGITQGTTVTTGLSVSVELKYADIKQAITDLSNYKVNGSFDFDIDTGKKLNLYYPTKGSLRSNIVFDDNNILAHAVKIPVVLNITNSVFVTGQGINNDIAQVNRQASAPIIAEYTLLEDVISDTQTADTSTLSAEGDRKLALEELPLYLITLKHSDDVDLTTYGLGDTVVVNITEEQISYAQYRVKKRTVDIDQTGTMVATLDLLTI